MSGYHVKNIPVPTGVMSLVQLKDALKDVLAKNKLSHWPDPRQAQ